MLEEIIEKTVPKSSEDNELPKSLPSSHSKYVTHQTTFGRVRVDLPSKSKQRQMIESLYKTYDPANEQYRTFDAKIWSSVDKDIHENDIDFYGLVNAHYRNIKFEESLTASKEEEEPKENYIDQLAFPELMKPKEKTKSPPIVLKKETIDDLKSQAMNFIDEQYFGTLKQIEHQEQPSNVTQRIEMPPADELNYIDQLCFASPTPTKPEKTIPETSSQLSASDNLLEINFQYPISTPKPKPTTKPTVDSNEPPLDVYNPKLETMRSIKSKDYFDPPRQSALDVQKDIESDKSATQSAEQIREQLTKKTNARDSLGYRTFESIVPKWDLMTKAEITDILIKQICFIRHGILALDKPYGLPTVGGPGVKMSIAHFIPKIIERLNRPDVKQLHLLHRLDKQSTGVLLMAYTPEAEKRLRELMQERKLIKQYITIVRGIPQPPEGEIDIPIVERNVRGAYKMMLSPAYDDLTKLVMPKAKRNHIDSSPAITKYRVIDSNYAVSLLECQPVTGVKHQIRTHLAHALGTPIFGDHKYSHYAKLAPQKLQFATLKKLGVRQAKVRTIPLCLHSYSVAIPNFLQHQQNIFIRARLSHHLRYFIQCFRLRMFR